MQIVYLESTKEDLVWMRYYYEAVFPQGAKKAQARFHAIEQLIIANPFLGQAIHRENVYEFSIPKTPFSYIYRVKPDHIAVLRIWDERQGKSIGGQSDK